MQTIEHRQEAVDYVWNTYIRPKKQKESSGSQADETRSSWNGNFCNLHVKAETVNKILNGVPYPDRSTAMWSVIYALVGCGLSDADIFGVFDQYPIGEKYREKGQAKEKWLQKQIDKARAKVTPRTDHSSSSQQSAGVDPNDPPDPLPLTRESVSAESYPVDNLGPTLSPAVKKTMDIIQAPDAVCAHAFLAAAALCVQPYANIKIDGRSSPVSENFISICATGGRKSEADKTATAEVRQWEEGQLREYRRAYKEYSDAYEAYQNQRKKITNNKKLSLEEQGQQLAALRQSEPEKPFNPVRLTTDPTFEGLVKLFERSLPSLGLFADEGGLFSGGFSMSQEKQLYSAAGYSKFWDGARIDRIRAGSESFSLYDRRLTMHLMMQDQVAGDFFNNPVLQDQGLLSRFLVSFPAPTVGGRTYKEENLMESPEMRRFGNQVNELLNREMPLKVDKKTGQVLNELEPADLELVPEAKRFWIEFYQQVEFNSGKDGLFESIPGFANKAPEHCLRVAGILTLFDDPGARVIDLPHVEAATALVEYYLNERIRIRGLSQPDQQLLRAQELLKWLRDKSLSRVCLPDVYQYGPNKLRTAQQARDTVSVLVNHYYLIHQDGKHKSEIDGKTTRESWIVR